MWHLLGWGLGMGPQVGPRCLAVHSDFHSRLLALAFNPHMSASLFLHPGPPQRRYHGEPGETVTGVRGQVPECDPAQRLLLCELPVGRCGTPSGSSSQAPSPSPHHLLSSPVMGGWVRATPPHVSPPLVDGRCPTGWPGGLQEEGPCGISGGCPPHTGPEGLRWPPE